MSDVPFLELDRLTLVYGRTVAVSELSLKIAKGELVALLGPSGCGKSTTMRAIAGLVRAHRGQLTLAGRNITHVPANKREVGLVFQSYALFPHLSVEENVAFGLRLRRVPREEVERRSAEVIRMVGLTGFEKRLPRELSGGQQQRVAFARSVIVRPQVLLLDEPLSNLDARLRLEMRSELCRLQRDLGITMIYVTHDQAEALALANRVVVMSAGKIAQAGTPEEIYERPRSGFVARFMGFENIFRIEHSRLIGERGALTASHITTREVAGLAWRPRAVVVGTGPYEGNVVGASYLGDTVEYLIDSSAGSIKAQTAAERPRFVPGSTIRFDLPVAAAAHLAEA
jgi:putative spermidine/putrescine transport system ATP-binding protein